MRYLPHTEEDIRPMLATVGRGSLDELFAEIPADCRRDGDMDLPQPLTEWQLLDHMEELDSMMAPQRQLKVLFGAGSYDHHIPEIVRQLSSRSEFLTAYTPYQPEIAQGTLQGIFEYQTLTARLLGMEVANSSMYDGASALAEALLMGLRISKKKSKVAISLAIHPHYREVVKTYFQATDFEIVELPVNVDGSTDWSLLARTDDLAAAAVQSPNFFGVVEDLQGFAESVHEVNGIAVSCFTEPFTYGIYKNPGEAGMDIVCGEGQSFGLARSYGGAGLGMFGCLQKYVRAMPGRLVGQTVDMDGKRGFVLTLNTREQHIRREKATSNICSNQGICALTAGIYMAAMGGTGLRHLAGINFDKAEYFKRQLRRLGAKVSDQPTFNEFVATFDRDIEPARNRLKEKNILAGLDLSPWYPDRRGSYLFGVTEKTTKDTMDLVAEEVRNG